MEGVGGNWISEVQISDVSLYLASFHVHTIQVLLLLTPLIVLFAVHGMGLHWIRSRPNKS